MNKKGFTFLELLVSLFIVGIIVVPFLAMYAQNIENTDLSSEITQTTLMAQKVAETTYALTYRELIDLQGEDMSISGGFTGTLKVKPSGTYNNLTIKEEEYLHIHLSETGGFLFHPNGNITDIYASELNTETNNNITIRNECDDLLVITINGRTINVAKDITKPAIIITIDIQNFDRDTGINITENHYTVYPTFVELRTNTDNMVVSTYNGYSFEYFPINVIKKRGTSIGSNYLVQANVTIKGGVGNQEAVKDIQILLNKEP